jgi:hypothetical protein
MECYVMVRQACSITAFEQKLSTSCSEQTARLLVYIEEPHRNVLMISVWEMIELRRMNFMSFGNYITMEGHMKESSLSRLVDDRRAMLDTEPCLHQTASLIVFS